jgi:hypothetical protein
LSKNKERVILKLHITSEIDLLISNNYKNQQINKNKKANYKLDKK